MSVMANSARCPACAAPHPAAATVCPSCGLLFTAATMALPDLPVSPRKTGVLRVGQQLDRGRYTVQRPLAQGGMGTLYLASDHSAFDRTVVVKVMLHAQDDERFLEEARMLAGLNHPVIPQILAHFQDGAHHCIVMEYIEGDDLQRGLTRSDEASDQTVQGQAYPIDDVVHWGIELCRILEYLASRPTPIVHHDIKPANLVRDSQSGALFLVDFGTARAANDQSGSYGTPGYAPPEQYHGASEPRSDVFALAATLYHLATDDDPAAHPFAFPRLFAIGALGRALTAALEQDVAQRPTAAELRKKLERCQSILEASSISLPDGSSAIDAGELVRWCEENQAAAIKWLYPPISAHAPDIPPLADQVDQRWSRSEVARTMRLRLRQHADEPAYALDTILALIAPQGYGSLRPQLMASERAIDFGTLEAFTANERRITINNIGRRFARAEVQLPEWVEIMGSPGKIALAAGDQTTLILGAYQPQRADTKEQLHGNLIVNDNTSMLVQVPLEAQCAAQNHSEQLQTRNEAHVVGRDHDPIAKAMWVVPVAVIVVFLLIEGANFFMIVGLGGIGALAWWLYKR